MRIPDDIFPIVREIDQSLKDEGIPPHSRPIKAVIEFGKRFHINVPIAKLPPGAPADLVANSVYTDRIHGWYEEVYGVLIKTDFSEKSKVAVLADGDIWEMRIPLIYGLVTIEAQRGLPSNTGIRIGAQVRTINACAFLTGITEARLKQFSDDDLQEVYGLFRVGHDVREAFKRFGKDDPLFSAAEQDWFAAVAHMTNQSPSWDQARWSSLQMTEKFMKGLIKIIGDHNVPRQGHSLVEVHDVLARSIKGFNLRHLIADIQCDASSRYHEAKTPSTLKQAYAAQKASLLVIRVLGGMQYSQN
jgi:hypothetical protein